MRALKITAVIILLVTVVVMVTLGWLVMVLFTAAAFSLTGEFAQLRPSSVQTIAFDRTRRELRDFTQHMATCLSAGITAVTALGDFQSAKEGRRVGFPL